MATTQQSRESAAAVSEAFMAAYNTGDLDRIDEHVTDEFVCHHKASGEEIEGGEAYKGRIAYLREAFPDFEMHEEFILVDGDRCAGHYCWAGTHEGEFQGVPATGTVVETTSAVLMRMEGPKMAEMWVYGDARGLMEQLGVSPK